MTILSTMNPTNSQPILILIRGLPGSGKSYIASALRNKIGSADVVMLDPDATNYESATYIDFSASLTRDGVDEKLHPYRFLRSQAHEGIVAGKHIIWNQAFTNLEIFNKMTSGLEAYAVDHDKKLACVVVEVQIDPATAKSRIADRHKAGNHNVPDEAFNRFVRDYKSFVDEGYVVVQVSGEADVDESVAAIEQKLRNL
jgi:thymidylate kinase